MGTFFFISGEFRIETQFTVRKHRWSEFYTIWDLLKKAEVNVRGSELTGNPQEREVSECRVSLYCHKQSGPDQM